MTSAFEFYRWVHLIDMRGAQQASASTSVSLTNSSQDSTFRQGETCKGKVACLSESQEMEASEEPGQKATSTHSDF